MITLSFCCLLIKYYRISNKWNGICDVMCGEKSDRLQNNIKRIAISFQFSRPISTHVRMWGSWDVTSYGCVDDEKCDVSIRKAWQGEGESWDERIASSAIDTKPKVLMSQIGILQDWYDQIVGVISMTKEELRSSSITHPLIRFSLFSLLECSEKWRRGWRRPSEFRRSIKSRPASKALTSKRLGCGR